MISNPEQDRKTRATIMLEQQGMEESEARTAVEDIDKAMGNKQAVFTKKEALKILPKLVREANLSVIDFLKLSREFELLDKMKKAELNFIKVEQGRQGGREVEYTTPPTVCHDISHFYSDRGPDTKLEDILAEETLKGENNRYVLKERESEQKSLVKPKAPCRVRGSNKKTKAWQPVKAPPPAKLVKTQTRPTSRWPEVKPCYRTSRQLGDSQSQPVSQIISQLNSLQSLEPETDGPFNFRKLLRRTDAAPTHSLRMRRNIGIDFVQDLDGDIQVL